MCGVWERHCVRVNQSYIDFSDFVTSSGFPDPKKITRHKIIYVIHLIGCKEQLINLKLFSVEYPVRAISMAVLTKDPGTHWFWTGT